MKGLEDERQQGQEHPEAHKDRIEPSVDDSGRVSFHLDLEPGEEIQVVIKRTGDGQETTLDVTRDQGRPST